MRILILAAIFSIVTSGQTFAASFDNQKFIELGRYSEEFYDDDYYDDGDHYDDKHYDDDNYYDDDYDDREREDHYRYRR